MGSMTQDFGRLASAITESRNARIEAAARRRKAVHDRHAAVGAMLKDFKNARLRAGHAQRASAASARRSRHTEVRALLGQFRRHREAWLRGYITNSARFMRDLTSGVAALRDAFSASQHSRETARSELVKSLRDRLTAHGRDRHEATATWRGSRARKSASSSDEERAGSRHGGQAKPAKGEDSE